MLRSGCLSLSQGIFLTWNHTQDTELGGGEGREEKLGEVVMMEPGFAGDGLELISFPSFSFPC